MKINQETANKIKSFEGFRLQAYRDPVGIPTIGWGSTFNHAKNRRVQMGDSITEQQAQQFFDIDTQHATDKVLSYVKRPINVNELSAFVSLAHNIGTGAFSNSTALKRFNSGDKAGAAEAILWWNKATDPNTKKKFVLPGLVARRAWEAEMFARPISAEEEVSPNMPGEVKANEPRDSLKSSRTIVGVGVIAIAQALQAFAEEVHQFSAISPYIEYVFMGLTLAAAGLILYARIDDFRKLGK